MNTCINATADIESDYSIQFQNVYDFFKHEYKDINETLSKSPWLTRPQKQALKLGCRMTLLCLFLDLVFSTTTKEKNRLETELFLPMYCEKVTDEQYQKDYSQVGDVIPFVLPYVNMFLETFLKIKGPLPFLLKEGHTLLENVKKQIQEAALTLVEQQKLGKTPSNKSHAFSWCPDFRFFLRQTIIKKHGPYQSYWFHFMPDDRLAFNAIQALIPLKDQHKLEKNIKYYQGLLIKAAAKKNVTLLNSIYVKAEKDLKAKTKFSNEETEKQVALAKN